MIGSLLAAAFVMSCNNDDDSTETFQERDRGEQEAEDRVALQEYLETHFYNYEDFENPPADFDYVVRFDTINEANADKIPLIESDLLETKTITRDDVDYTIYVLKVREGAQEQPTFADSTFVTYKGELLNRDIFDSAATPVWFDLTRIVPGLTETMTEFKGASGFEINDDNTISWTNDFGIGAAFFPSGLGYYARGETGIPAYSPLVFAFQLFGINEADHDRDGIPSRMEDLNNDRILANDNTDGDNYSNYIDSDDDGDFIPTREEIVIEEDRTITFPDTNNNGVPDYLDPLV